MTKQQKVQNDNKKMERRLEEHIIHSCEASSYMVYHGSVYNIFKQCIYSFLVGGNNSASTNASLIAAPCSLLAP